MQDNPLLAPEGLPRFAEIKPEHVEPAIDALLQQHRAALTRLLNQSQYTWENLVEPLEHMAHRLEAVWSPVRHLNSVISSDALRDAYNRCIPKLSEYATELAQNRALYEAYRFIADHEPPGGFSPIQRRVLNKALRDFHLGGVDLPEAEQQRFKEISRSLTELSAHFEDNVLDATHAWFKPVGDVSELAGLPEHALDLLHHAAAQRERSGYALTLDYPVYIAVMTYAHSRSLREEMYRAYTTRASELYFDPRWDNTATMETILRLRHELAQLLGYRSYAEYSLATKMARTPGEVLEFLSRLTQEARTFARAEKAVLERFAMETEGYQSVEPWDILYLTENYKKINFELSQDSLKPYFPIERVTAGLFEILRRLFGVEVAERPAPNVWHPDVKFYELRDRFGHLRGQFYLDLYARPRKRSGAWMDVCRDRMQIPGQTPITPVAYLTCNAAPPVGDKPALLSHDELTTLLHEFGHGLHHMLTQVDIPSVAGINGVEWDAVELPSQWLENFAWHHEGLALLSGHYLTGEPLPDVLLEKLLALRQFQTGLQFVRQLEFAVFDMRLHAEYDPVEGPRVHELLAEIRTQVAAFTPPAYNRFPNTFTHIFSGGYAAGYYGYKWAEVLAADTFARFREHGVFDRSVGESFMTEILEVGSTRPALESFIAFRGREPSIDALLELAGFRSLH